MLLSLLDTPDKWKGRNTDLSPPEYWNRTQYEFEGSGTVADFTHGIDLVVLGQTEGAISAVVTPELLDPLYSYNLVVVIGGSDITSFPLTQGEPIKVLLPVGFNTSASIYISTDGEEEEAFGTYKIQMLPVTVHSYAPYGSKRALEQDVGWSFDSIYIAHFLELNWYFGENPFTYKSVPKIRIHGLAKGQTKLEVAVAGMQTEYDSDYTEAQHVDLPLNMPFVQEEFFPTTNYVDSSNRGISLQLKFEGRNEDIYLPEPSHVLQVLALQTSPADVGKRAN